MFVAHFTPQHVAAVAPSESTNIGARQLLADTNQARQTHNLAPLTYSDDLTNAAQAKLDDMIAEQYWSHEAPDGTSPWHWYDSVGYEYSTAGENLARGYQTADATIDAWLDSPSHRENLLDHDYTEVGFATKTAEFQGKSTTLTVALYAKPATLMDRVAALFRP